MAILDFGQETFAQNLKDMYNCILDGYSDSHVKLVRIEPERQLTPNLRIELPRSFDFRSHFLERLLRGETSCAVLLHTSLAKTAQFLDAPLHLDVRHFAQITWEIVKMVEL